MTEKLKDFYSHQRIMAIAQVVAEYDKSFDTRNFCQQVQTDSWQDFSLKQRQTRLSFCLYHAISGSYEEKLALLCQVAQHFGRYAEASKAERLKENIAGNYQYMFFPGVVEQFGPHKPEAWSASLDALAAMTMFSSSEFAVRPFLAQNSRAMLRQMLCWSQDQNYHVRRLASEGCRPRLPWATQLPMLISDPTPIIPILSMLYLDTSAYVRRSVANNLNDISKTHPELTLDTCESWLKKSAEALPVVQHGLRGLLKQGNERALSLCGFDQSAAIQLEQLEFPQRIKIGATAVLACQLTQLDQQSLGRCRIEYAIDFCRQGQRRSRKVFQISSNHIAKPQHQVQKPIQFIHRSTRRLYPGQHQISLIINGKCLASQAFALYN